MYFIPKKHFSSEIELELIVEFYWYDTRLNVTDCDGFIDKSTLQKIWTPQPDVLHKSFIEKVERIGGTTDYISADPDYLYWWLKLYVGIQCPFDFSFYPFDTHHCDVLFQSHVHTNKVVNYTSSDPYDESMEIQHALKYDVEYKIQTNEEKLSYDYPTCGFTVKLSRHLQAALINKFIPSFMLVMISFCRYPIIHLRKMT